MKTTIVATGETKDRLSTQDYLALVAQLDYHHVPAVVVRAVEAGDAGARFAVYGTALRKGLIRKGSK